MYFKEEEFWCKCSYPDCDAKLPPNAYLLSALENTRATFGEPLYVISGWRCQRHNERVGGKPASAHLTGEAADLWIKGGWNSFKRIKFLDAARQEGFDRIGLGRSKCHVDSSVTLPTPRLWIY